MWVVVDEVGEVGGCAVVRAVRRGLIEKLGSALDRSLGAAVEVVGDISM